MLVKTGMVNQNRADLKGTKIMANEESPENNFRLKSYLSGKISRTMGQGVVYYFIRDKPTPKKDIHTLQPNRPD